MTVVLSLSIVVPGRTDAHSALARASISVTTSVSDVPRWAKQAVWYQIFPERFRT